MSFLHDIDSTWTLFLDRDGVINVEKDQDYIRNRNEFHFYPGVPEHFSILNRRFARVLVVTNQRGIGKGLMSENDLHDIHAYLQGSLKPHGAHIDAFYFARDLNTDATDRKPNTGMGLQAKRDFPDIDFSRSVMVGNNLSDMEFGRRLGMHTVYVHTTKPLPVPHPDVSLDCPDLVAFCRMLDK
jgi:HAD superfamily hydrolase (TIGR01662 family)